MKKKVREGEREEDRKENTKFFIIARNPFFL